MKKAIIQLNKEIETKKYHEDKANKIQKDYTRLCKLNKKQFDSLSKEEQKEIRILEEDRLYSNHSDLMFSKGFIFGYEQQTKEICKMIEDLLNKNKENTDKMKEDGKLILPKGYTMPWIDGKELVSKIKGENK